jgi:hypothetical protein
MNAICLVVAGMLRATLPTNVCDGDRCRTLTSIIAAGAPSSDARGRIEVVDMQACRRANG